MYLGTILVLIFGIVGFDYCSTIQWNTAPRLVRKHSIYKRQAVTNGKPTCHPVNEFMCDKMCLNISSTCNGFFDCDDETDESYETCHLRTCSSSRYRCKSGGCIHKNKICDGYVSCIDSDDETYENCKNYVCPAGKFPCNYGGCFKMRFLCNGDADCVDSSDEDPKRCAKMNATNTTISSIPTITTTTTNRPRVDPSACVLPAVTPDKSYTINYCPTDITTCGTKPGEKVPKHTAITVRCNHGYAANYPDGGGVDDHSPVSLCLNGSWRPTIIKCKKICKELRHLDLNLTCSQYVRGPRIPCTGILLEGATVIPRCKPQYYTKTRINYRYVTCKKDGTWDKDFFECSPDCGKTPSSTIDLIAKGRPEKRGEAPWNLAIYSTESSKDPSFICGGTLISDELVISAAHCFHDQVFGRALDPRLFLVIVGKITRNFKTQDFPTTKTYTLKNIYYPKETVFKGESTNYASDIAILHLSNRVTLSQDVLPACVYWEDRDRFNPGENVPGKLSGFGVTENGTLASELLTANLPYISYSECVKKVSTDFQDSISVDKFCAGYVDGAGARVGDSGGGLVFKDKKNGFFHLRGVVSNKDTTSSSIATFTDIAQYMTWITKIVANVDHLRISDDTLVNFKSKI